MSIIYKTSDKIKVQIDDIVLVISPLSYQEKNAIQGLLVKGNVDSLMEGATMALKSAIKGVEGIKYSDGSNFQLELEDGKLSDESLDELMNVKCQDKIAAVCMGLIQGIPEDFINAETGEVIEGVKILRGGDAGKKE